MTQKRSTEKTVREIRRRTRRKQGSLARVDRLLLELRTNWDCEPDFEALGLFYYLKSQ